MLLDPVNAVTSFDFYKALAKQSFGRSLLYLAYIGLVFSLLATFALKLKIGAAVDDTFDWLAKSVPAMTYADGKLSSTAPMPLRLQSPRAPEIALMIDTTRTDAVSPQLMTDQKVTAYVTANALYLKQTNGELRVWDLSKPQGQPQAGGGPAQPIRIDADFFKSAGTVLDRVMYPVAFVIIFVLFVVWKLLTSVFFSLIGLLVNALGQGALEYGALLNLAVYAQTPAIALQVLSLFLPFAVPGGTIISLGLTTLYLWLAVKRQSEPASLPA